MLKEDLSHMLFEVGLRRRDSIVQAVWQGTSISIQEFTEAHIADSVERC